MSDIGKSGDAVILPSTGYFLKLVYDYFLYVDCERLRTTTSSTSTTIERLLLLQRVFTAIICLHQLSTATSIQVTLQ
jgi:hypothetical protein